MFSPNYFTTKGNTRKLAICGLLMGIYRYIYEQGIIDSTVTLKINEAFSDITGAAEPMLLIWTSIIIITTRAAISKSALGQT